ncbi:MAG: type II secretion system F family protein [Candidatus Omnitrophica bacterium]|nr:type II secretion system F family protein [Candidatus Omnitrophota bacterium]
MMTFEYHAKDKNGSAVTGIIEANSEAEVAEALHKKQLVIVSVQPAKKKDMRAKDKKVKLDDLVIFSRQLATLIDSGIPLVQCLNILGEQVENKNFQEVVIKMRQDIEAGMSFCDALGSHPSVFSELFINMARAGEASGMLDDVLDRLAAYLEKQATLTRKIRSSLIYPAVVVTMAISITVFLLLKVVPTFKSIFDMLGGQLPLPTRILIGISEFLQHYLLVIVAFLIAFSVAFKKYIATEKGRFRFDDFVLKVAVLGPLFRKVALAKFARTFSTLIKSGVSVLNALEIVAKVAGNKVIEQTIIQCRQSVREGEPISKPLSKSNIFPSMVWRMIGVGEQTGQLEKMLGKIADFYEEQVDAAVSGLTSIIEPLVIAFLGIVIGGIVVALFVPVFKISQLISK